jgi:hypothetical protein
MGSSRPSGGSSAGIGGLFVVVQLIPLPTAIWSAFPGRTLFEQSPLLIGDAAIGRPMTRVPSATVSALISLIMPAVSLGLLTQLDECGMRLTPYLAIDLVLGAAFVGALQMIGITFDNPFVNDTRGDVSGMFANRNISRSL